MCPIVLAECGVILGKAPITRAIAPVEKVKHSSIFVHCTFPRPFDLSANVVGKVWAVFAH